MKRQLEDKELKDKVFSIYLDNLETSCSVIDGIIPVVWKFDNKVYNARFDNAIKDFLSSKEEFSKISSKVHFSSSNVNIELAYYYNRCARDTEKNRVRYIPSGFETVSICYKWQSSESSSYYPDRKKDIENGFYTPAISEVNKWKDDYFYRDSGKLRIKSARIVEYLLEKQKELKENINKLRDSMNKVIEWNNEVEELKSKLEELDDSIPYSIRQIYNIKSYGVFN